MITVSDFAAAAELGARPGNAEIRYDLMDGFARLAGAGILSIPIAATYALDEIAQAAAPSQSGHARGKLLLLP